MTRHKQIGDRVILVGKSYRHFVNYMSVSGEIIKIDNEHYQGKHRRPYLVRFTDSRESWYAANEITKL